TARRRGVELYLAVLGTCDGANPGMAPVSASPLYQRLARETGGIAFAATKEGVGQVLQVIDEQSRSGNTALARAVRPTTATAKNKAIGGPMQVSVDATITRLAVIVSGTSDVRIVRPSGADVAPGATGVERIGLERGVVYRIDKPEPGTWSVFNPGGEATVSVRADSPLGLLSASFVESSGRGPHDGYVPIDGQALVGKPQKVDVRLDSPVAGCNLELRDEQGEVLVQAAMRGDADAPGEFFGEITPPSQPFVLHVTGTTLQGQAFQRSLQRVDRAQYLHVDAPYGIEAERLQTVDYRFTLRNDGPADSFDIALFEAAGFLKSPAKQTIELAAGQSTEVTASLSIGASAERSTLHRLSLVATSRNSPPLQTSAVVNTMLIERNDADADGVADPIDNCPDVPNPDQSDANADKVGDTCETKKPDAGCNAASSSDGSPLLLGLGLMLLGALRSRRRATIARARARK
ncbi:MAG: hypothetical protein RLZZ450_5657, partial [Pseudomonadota bacterium]